MIQYKHVSDSAWDATVNGHTVRVTKSRERGYPDMPGVQNGGRPHLAMYEAAIEFLGSEPLRVLDFACGSGYGTHALRQAGHLVHGSDASEEAIEFMRAAYGHGYGLESDVADMGKPWPWADAAFDAVVSVESIEHTERYELALREAHRVVRPGGCLFITTPAGSKWKPIGEFHTQEWDMVQFADLLARTGWSRQQWIPADCWVVACLRGER